MTNVAFVVLNDGQQFVRLDDIIGMKWVRTSSRDSCFNGMKLYLRSFDTELFAPMADARLILTALGLPIEPPAIENGELDG